MNVKRMISVALAVLVISLVAPAYANAIPELPHAFYGTLKINGSDAPIGAWVEARGKLPETVVMTGIPSNPIVTNELGKYGGPGGLDPKLVVQGTIADGAEIEFFVSQDGATWYKAVTEPSPVEWHSGDISMVDLTVTIPVNGGGGGGGGGGRGDATPPIISNVGSCMGGITDTTADICWDTNEPSTTQMEYWASPGILSPLDATLATDHHVNLTGLTPLTTYHYKSMSRDGAGNLAISPEFTFTTLAGPEEPAPAAFVTSALSITPEEVNIGEEVTISVLVTNTGDVTGSYEVTLEVDEVSIATEEVTLDGGASQTVTFTTTEDVDKTYAVTIDDLSGTFVVTEVAPPPTPVNWPLIVGIIAGVIVVGLLIFFAIRRGAY